MTMGTTSGLRDLLDCLSARLPALREGLLAGAGDALERVDLPAGRELLRKGGVADALYVVVVGKLRATTTQDDGTELTLSEFGPGELAGEMAILAGGGVYGATVTAVTDAVLVRVPRAAFERSVKATPQAVHEMAASIRRRLARDQLAIGLPRLFGAIDETMLRFIEARVEWTRLRAGAQLFAAGDRSEDLYFVVGGRLRAVSPEGRVLGEMTRGESIGEIALLTGEPRTATVTAVRDSELVHVVAPGIRRNRREIPAGDADDRPDRRAAYEGARTPGGRHPREVHHGRGGRTGHGHRGFLCAARARPGDGRTHAASVGGALRHSAQPERNRRRRGRGGSGNPAYGLARPAGVAVPLPGL